MNQLYTILGSLVRMQHERTRSLAIKEGVIVENDTLVPFSGTVLHFDVDAKLGEHCDCEAAAHPIIDGQAAEILASVSIYQAKDAPASKVVFKNVKDEKT